MTSVISRAEKTGPTFGFDSGVHVWDGLEVHRSFVELDKGLGEGEVDDKPIPI